MNIHEKCFHLVESAPLCSGSLWGTFGYNATCQTLHEILEGACAYPLYFDQATKGVLQKCAIIQLKIPKSLVNMMITKEGWHNHWNRAKEETSSSKSRRRFGHYKAGLRSECISCISYFQTLIATSTIRRGIVSDHWSQGLSVMLEKKFG